MVSRPQKMSSTQIKTGTCCLNCGIAINDHTLSSWIHTFYAVAVLKVKKKQTKKQNQPWHLQ